MIHDLTTQKGRNAYVEAMSKTPKYLGISTNRIPTKEEIIEEMELHNADEVGINNQWSFEDAEYHLTLSDKFK